MREAQDFNATIRVEATIHRFKQVIGERLRVHSDEGQRTEVVVACNVLNRMFGLARPTHVRIS